MRLPTQIGIIGFSLVVHAVGALAFEGPGPERTGGFVVDYRNCNIGQEVYSPGSACCHGNWPGLGRRHAGIDIYNDFGVPVVAAAPGTVHWLYSGNGANRGSGRQIIIRHRGFYTFYNHLDSIEANVRKGRRVKRGETIGKIGMSGTTVPHLHFSLLTSLKKGAHLPNVHAYWHVPKADRDAKRVIVPYFDLNIKYRHDALITMPILFKNCKKKN